MLDEESIRRELHAGHVVPLPVVNPHGPLGLEQLAAAASNAETAQTQPSRPIPPAEVSSWIIDKLPPELLEHERQNFNKEEYLAALREVARTGGLELNDFIHEIEQGEPPGAPGH